MHTVDVKQLEALAEPVAAGIGYEVVDLEWKHEAGHWVLRLYIDRPNALDEERISLGDCSKVSHALSDALDAADVIHVPYALEVSSPGLDRPLKRERDFARFVGRQAKVKTRRPVGDTRRNFKGKILAAEAGRVRMDVDGTAFEIPVDDVEKANLVVEL